MERNRVFGTRVLGTRVLSAVLGLAALPLSLGVSLTLAGSGHAGWEGAPVEMAQFDRDLTVEIGRPRPPVVAPALLPVNVGLTPIGSSVIRIGTPIRFQATTNATGYAHAYIASASGRVVMLMENVAVQANTAIQLPRGGLTIRATPPAGDDTVYFVVTRDRFPGYAGGASTSTPTDIQVSESALTRDLNRRLSNFPRERWAWTQTTVRVSE